jgi:hypothetical protein
MKKDVAVKQDTLKKMKPGYRRRALLEDIAQTEDAITMLEVRNLRIIVGCETDDATYIIEILAILPLLLNYDYIPPVIVIVPINF